MNQPHDVTADFDRFREDVSRLRAEVAKVIVGQESILLDLLTAIVSGGHVLLEGVPGLGKTLLMRTLADALDLSFQRIQFTPDLMPADLIGTNVAVEGPDGRRTFEFQAGPLFANIVLADEINRATPKTQSALLEAMQEHSITVANCTHKLSQPFFVMATQNPLEMEGTYPLPEAQLDRFFCKLIVRFPTASQLETILDRTTEVDTPQASAVLTGERLSEMAVVARQVAIADEVRRYGIALVLATHPDHETATPETRKYVRYGASPRGLQSLVLAAKVRAILDDRLHVARTDLRSVLHPVLRHRLILNFEAEAENVAVDDVLTAVANQVSDQPVCE